MIRMFFVQYIAIIFYIHVFGLCDNCLNFVGLITWLGMQIRYDRSGRLSLIAELLLQTT